MGAVIRAPFNNYVFDHSHDSERITNAKKDKVEKAYHHIVAKHSLSGKELARFKIFASSYLNDLAFSNLKDVLKFRDFFGVFFVIRRAGVTIVKRLVGRRFRRFK